MRGKQRHLLEKYYSLIEIETKAIKKKFVYDCFQRQTAKIKKEFYFYAYLLRQRKISKKQSYLVTRLPRFTATMGSYGPIVFSSFSRS